MGSNVNIWESFFIQLFKLTFQHFQFLSYLIHHTTSYLLLPDPSHCIQELRSLHPHVKELKGFPPFMNFMHTDLPWAVIIITLWKVSNHNWIKRISPVFICNDSINLRKTSLLPFLFIRLSEESPSLLYICHSTFFHTLLKICHFLEVSLENLLFHPNLTLH